MVMFSIEPILHCYAHQDEGLVTEQYEQARHLMHDDSVTGMVGIFLYYSLLLDLSVFSMKVSAFVLVCGRAARAILSSFLLGHLGGQSTELPTHGSSCLTTA